ncbi:hypothetical protein HYN56_19390 [Flavobacterium crocinum]|uniref:Right-handed parallel beta-helix repeat-containing protein n=1 Tax=Flavobacterium crocinum TaxID=2183896 RepID=A0A2S1YQC4_9FLAO|nr:hypothetical protein [Flavobacterium crocinum]AWK06275.1 hypothetical protein HYN56_19390 [Flavobacterium crocinum]
MRNFKSLLTTIILVFTAVTAEAENKVKQVETLEALEQSAKENGQNIQMKPGVYSLADYLTKDRITKLLSEFPEATGQQKRPPRWFLRFKGNNNTFDFTGVTFEINTELYKILPYGYTRCIFIDGNGNAIKGLTIKNTGPKNIGSNGNILSIFGDNTLLEDVKLYVSGSTYGYGDLFGKGGPNLTSLQKQSGIMIAGKNNTIKRCKVFSRAFGHCFYIQTQGHVTDNVVLEDCYAEGEMRTTNDILAESGGLAEKLKYQSVYQNRDGRYMISPGYTKALCEDGFRTYGGVGKVTLRNCTSKNTRSGFEIGGTDDAKNQTLLQGCQAFGTERGFLIGSNVVVRDCRADMQFGPLLYLRENTVGADVELELVPGMPKSLVHTIATIAGKNHRVKLYANDTQTAMPSLPIMLGFGMPAHAEMSSPILPMPTENIVLINDLQHSFIIKNDDAKNLEIKSTLPQLTNTETQTMNGKGKW